MTDRQKAVVETLRYTARWVGDDGQIVLLNAAEMVEQWTPPQGGELDCCPVCEEIQCDDGCPLQPLREVTQ